MNKILSFFMLISLFFSGCKTEKKMVDVPKSFSGIYPHLAHYNNEAECGTGAVVPWQDRLWVISYGPHLPTGSSDKLYEISSGMQQVVHFFLICTRLTITLKVQEGVAEHQGCHGASLHL